MEYKYPVCRYIAVYKDHWEIREGTELDMNEIVDEFCDDGLVSEKGTTVPSVQMLYQDGIIDRDESNPKAFVNPFSAQFTGYGKAFQMNFVLVGFDDYTDEENDALRKMSRQEILQYVRAHPLDYRSLTDEEIAQCVQLLEAEKMRRENISIAAAVSRCPEAEKELHLQRDEVFMLHRVMQAGQRDDKALDYQPFLSFTDVLAAIRDELVMRDPSLPKSKYTLEKWASKGNFNMSFFRFRDELIEVEPPDEDFHMEQTAAFYMEGDEVTGFKLLDPKKPGKR